MRFITVSASIRLKPATHISLLLGFGRLSIHTLATNATHSVNGATIDELDVHNMFGLMEEKATHTALLEILPGKRPFIIARSTFPSTGRWSGHWVGTFFHEIQYWSDERAESSGTIWAYGSTCITTFKEFSSSNYSRFRWLVLILVDSVRLFCCLRWLTECSVCFSAKHWWRAVQSLDATFGLCTVLS